MIRILLNWQFSVAQVVVRQHYGYFVERCGGVSFNKTVVVFGCVVVVGASVGSLVSCFLQVMCARIFGSCWWLIVDRH